MQTFTYRAGSTTGLPALVLRWQYESAAGTWTNLDLSGYSFSLTLTDATDTVQLTKTTNITGGSGGTATVSWVAGDLDLSTGDYELALTATSGGLSRDYSPSDPIIIRIV